MELCAANSGMQMGRVMATMPQTCVCRSVLPSNHRHQTGLGYAAAQTRHAACCTFQSAVVAASRRPPTELQARQHSALDAHFSSESGLFGTWHAMSRLHSAVQPVCATSSSSMAATGLHDTIGGLDGSQASQASISDIGAQASQQQGPTQPSLDSPARLHKSQDSVQQQQTPQLPIPSNIAPDVVSSNGSHSARDDASTSAELKTASRPAGRPWTLSQQRAQVRWASLLLLIPLAVCGIHVCSAVLDMVQSGSLYAVIGLHHVLMALGEPPTTADAGAAEAGIAPPSGSELAGDEPPPPDLPSPDVVPVNPLIEDASTAAAASDDQTPSRLVAVILQLQAGLLELWNAAFDVQGAFDAWLTWWHTSTAGLFLQGMLHLSIGWWSCWLSYASLLQGTGKRLASAVSFGLAAARTVHWGSKFSQLLWARYGSGHLSRMTALLRSIKQTGPLQATTANHPTSQPHSSDSSKSATAQSDGHDSHNKSAMAKGMETSTSMPISLNNSSSSGQVQSSHDNHNTAAAAAAAAAADPSPATASLAAHTAGAAQQLAGGTQVQVAASQPMLCPAADVVLRVAVGLCTICVGVGVAPLNGSSGAMSIMGLASVGLSAVIMVAAIVYLFKAWTHGSLDFYTHNRQELLNQISWLLAFQAAMVAYLHYRAYSAPDVLSADVLASIAGGDKDLLDVLQGVNTVDAARNGGAALRWLVPATVLLTAYQKHWLLRKAPVHRLLSAACLLSMALLHVCF